MLHEKHGGKTPAKQKEKRENSLPLAAPLIAITLRQNNNNVYAQAPFDMSPAICALFTTLLCDFWFPLLRYFVTISTKS
jgi:hypothetical protein